MTQPSLVARRCKVLTGLVFTGNIWASETLELLLFVMPASERANAGCLSMFWQRIRF